jgi:uncharacterized pyridoxal phosphate-containing UPF0001 family protein
LDNKPVLNIPAYKKAAELNKSVAAMYTINFRLKKCISVNKSQDSIMNKDPSNDIPELTDKIKNMPGVVIELLGMNGVGVAEEEEGEEELFFSKIVTLILSLVFIKRSIVLDDEEDGSDPRTNVPMKRRRY